MKDEHKTKRQLINELIKLRHRIAELDNADIGRKQAEEALRKTNIFLSNILDSSSSISIIYTDLKQNVLFWNKGAENIFGFKAEEVVGRHKVDILYPDDEGHTKDAVEEVRASVIKNKIGISREIEEVRKDGRKLWISLTSTPRFDENGDVMGILGIGEDITERKRAEEQLQQSLEKSQRALQGTIDVLASVVEMRDPYTGGHQQRVTNLACAIAKNMRLSSEQTEGLRLAATIHDIGNIYIPAEILSKTSQLTEIEYETIKTHPQIGYEILNAIEFPWPVAEIVLQHHEMMDGSGYPQGISGEDIILEARILAVADVVETMVSHRLYRPARGTDDALEEILHNKGILYDPEVVEACLRAFYDKVFKFE